MQLCWDANTGTVTLSMWIRSVLTRRRKLDDDYLAIVFDVGVAFYHLAENNPQWQTLEDRVAEFGVEVDCVMVTVACPLDSKHTGASQVADETPDGALS